METSDFSYDFLDERTGRWTRIEYAEGRVLIWPATTHMLSEWIGFAAKLIVVFAIVTGVVSVFGNHYVLISAFVMAVVVYYSGRKFAARRRRLEQPFLIISMKAVACTSDNNMTVLSSNDIDSVCLRENAGRDVEDPALWQTYVHVRSTKRGIVVHQRPKWNRQAERAVAAELADKLRVPLVEQLA